MLVSVLSLIYSITCTIGLYYVIESLWRWKYIKNYEQKCVLITGCDSGFGNAIAKKLDRLGLRVIAGCFTGEGQRALVEETSIRLTTLSLDVTSTDSILNLHRDVSDILSSENIELWGLLSNAGIFGDLGPAEWSTKKDYERLLEVNLYGSIRMVDAFLPLIKKSKGRLIFTTSIIGRMASYGTTAYATSKYAMEAYCDCLRQSMRSFGVSVHMIEPGSAITSLNCNGDVDKFKEIASGTWDRLPTDVKEKWGLDYYDKWCNKFIQNYFAMAPASISGVVYAMENALLSQHPRARYPVGVDANCFVLPIQKMPEWVGDAILMNPVSGPPKPHQF